MTSRWKVGAITVGLLVALGSCGDGDVSVASQSSTPTTMPPGSSSEPSTTASISVPADTMTSASTTTSSTTKPSTTAIVALPQIADGELHIEPPGPYVNGQSVRLYANDSTRIDVYNSGARVCAVIDGADEVCSADWMRPRVVRPPPVGTQAIAVDLHQEHFGPDGLSDCGEQNVECRILWRNEAGDLLSGPLLEFDGTPSRRFPTLRAELTGEPGVIQIDTTNVAFDTSLDGLPEAQLAAIAEQLGDVFGDETAFDISKLEIEWSVGSLCGFGPATGPIGSEDLIDPPSWWIGGTTGRDDTLQFFGPVCDWNAVTGSLATIDSTGTLELRVRRDLYGYGGWVDCAASTCFITIGWSWLHPEPGGGRVGAEGETIRVPVNIPESWPSLRPSLSIIEPGPYKSGDEVTVEAVGLTGDETAIGWCPGGDAYCSWKFAPIVDGVASVQWTIGAPSENCGQQRCYFALDSASEGLAPPAIVIAPVVDR